LSLELQSNNLALSTTNNNIVAIGVELLPLDTNGSETDTNISAAADDIVDIGGEIGDVRLNIVGVL